ncbi:MAG: ATP-binding protein [Albidovulum sp.]|uniref:AlbA family DNA-binding domain-containing protein n=1 Tax=Albidovulum sp. TaxID=1872424 RepID=UPI001328DF86|nr:ATP-binding protein [Defluviimonas sp.]KAB2883295.1 MAG: ATP-binding protein [Defluviimonas sp.]
MSRKSISDNEIGLIKAMLRRGMRNRDIQFYFNRQDRPVNSGRITGIRSGDYGPEVPEATEAALDTFLAGFVPADVGVVIAGNAARPPTVSERAGACFVQREDGDWYLAGGETADQECKAQFDPRRMEPIVRAIAALANNRGGFVFVGVRNADCKVVGMPDTAFQDTDIVRITDKVKTLLTPTPAFSKDVLDVGGFTVGVIHVEKFPTPPVIVCRDADGLEDGSILFRYPGQSGKIKFGDLLAMLRERDRAATQALLASASRLNEIGADRALIVDTDKGEIDAGERRIVIDRALAEQLEFIREGEFDERAGAPSLRLIGDVHAVDREGQVVERIEGHALSPEMVLRAYLDRENVRSPMQYVCVSALVQRQWLPLFYFVRLAGGDLDAAIASLEDTKAVYRVSKECALERLRGRRSAFERAGGAIVDVVSALQAGRLDDLRERFTDFQIVRGVRGLPDGFHPDVPMFELLRDILRDADGDANVRSGLFRAAARLDELEHADRPG